jgi:hypothetical protein
MDTLMYCPCCCVVYFREKVCEPCSKTYHGSIVRTTPIPQEVFSAATTGETGPITNNAEFQDDDTERYDPDRYTDD